MPTCLGVGSGRMITKKERRGSTLAEIPDVTRDVAERDNVRFPEMEEKKLLKADPQFSVWWTQVRRQMKHRYVAGLILLVHLRWWPTPRLGRRMDAQYGCGYNGEMGLDTYEKLSPASRVSPAFRTKSRPTLPRLPIPLVYQTKRNASGGVARSGIYLRTITGQ